MAAPAVVPASPASTGLAPVAPQERVFLLDVLRGLCLFFVLWSNLNDWYYMLKPVTPIDEALGWIQEWLVESRFYSLLGFLFGIGFAIQLTRAEQQGQDGTRVFFRRMAVLAAFGVVHTLLIWRGDILMAYALPGVALVLFRRLAPRRLLIAAAALLLLFPYIVIRLDLLFHLSLPRWDAAWRVLTRQATEAAAHGTWAQAIVQGARQYWGWLERWLVGRGAASFLALFLLGLWAVRVDLIARLTRRRITIVWALLGALVCWAGLQYADIHLGDWWPAAQSASPPDWRELRFWWPPRGILFSFVGDIATWANAAVYALVFTLLTSYATGAKRLRPLAALGRMTLTTYLAQSVICTTLFYNWGFGLMNKVNFTGILLVTIALFAAQMAFSVWWLGRYRYGPAEWLWRSLAYGRRLPLRIVPLTSPGIAVY